MSRRKNTNRFIADAKRIMEENLPIARFNETLRHVEKLKEKYIELVAENERLLRANKQLEAINQILANNSSQLQDQISYLEEILNSLHLIVSIQDVRRKNLLWYNQNYRSILGYRHKQLQELNCREAIKLYHPDDYKKIRQRNRIMSKNNQNHHTCEVRLRHTNGRWLRMRSDYIVLKRATDGSLIHTLEILSNISEE